MFGGGDAEGGCGGRAGRIECGIFFSSIGLHGVGFGFS